MVLGAYFDESVRNRQGREPISVAGYVFKPAAYVGFSKAWKRVLENGGPSPTTHFHMTNLYARDYEYKGWSADDRAGYLKLAIEAVNRYMLCGVSVMFGQDEFEKAAPKDWALAYGSIYSGACQLALRVTTHWMDKNKIYIPTAYAFESGHHFWNEANAILSATGKNLELAKAYRYHSHSAMSKEQSYGLQAADMLAWIITRMDVGVPKNHTMKAFAPIIMTLAAGRSKQYQLFHPEGDLLQRFFAEQVQNFDQSVVATYKKPRKMSLR